MRTSGLDAPSILPQLVVLRFESKWGWEVLGRVINIKSAVLSSAPPSAGASARIQVTSLQGGLTSQLI